MPYVQKRLSRKRFMPTSISTYQDLEYKCLEEWRKKQLKEQLAKQKGKPQVQIAKGKPHAAQLQSHITEQQPNRISSVSTPGHVEDPTALQSFQVEVLQSLQALKDQQEQQHNALKKMVFEIQRQVLRLQKNSLQLNRLPHSPHHSIVVKQEKTEI